MDPILILFDVDGTLIASAGAGKRSVEDAFAEVFGIEAVASLADGVRFAGMTDPLIFGALARAAGIDEATYDASVEPLYDAYLTALESEMARPDPRRSILPGVLPLLDDLAARQHVHLGLLTGNLERGARIKLEPFGLNPYFPGGGFGSDDPDRSEIARLAREKLSRFFAVEFDAERVFVVGDTEHDVSCARANGFRSIAVESGWTSRDILESTGPDALFADLSDRAAVLAVLGL